MKPCPHFEIWCKRVPRRVHSPEDGESFHEIKVPYCTHPQSPVPLEAAQQGLGEGAVLKCQGFVRRCPLPEDVRPQAEPRSQRLPDFVRSNLEQMPVTGTGGGEGE